MGRPRASTTVTQHWLRVPVAEWLAVKHGKREFRNVQPMLSLAHVETPTPVLAFMSGRRRHESLLMVLEESWPEPLGAISQASLEAEGVDTLAEFKVRWTATRARRFDPLQKVYVQRVRPWVPEDENEFGRRLLQKLYPDELRG